MYSEALRKFPPAPEFEVAAGGAPEAAVAAAGGAEVVGAGVASEDGAAAGVSSGLVVAVAADMIDDIE